MAVTWKLALGVWWSFTWRAMLYASVLGLIAGIALPLLGVGSFQAAMASPAAPFVQYAIFIPLMIFAVKQSLEIHVASLRKISDESPNPELQPPPSDQSEADR
jgi:hypothetical protein